jgi:hypothetical protein
MSKITHNNIVMWLEDVVPQMQKAASAEDCLLKYAKDHNMSPAILERMAHMFNSLKTNSAYNLAKTASDRGAFITTLDVPALVEKYSSLAQGLDYNKLISNVSKYTGLNDGQEIQVKLASINKVKEGDINDLCILSDLSFMRPSLNTKIAKVVNKEKNENKECKEDKDCKEKSKSEKTLEANKLLEEAHKEHAESLKKKTEAIKNLIKKYRITEFKGFHKAANELAYIIDDSDFTSIIDKVKSDIAKTNKVYGKYLEEDLSKTASIKGLIKESDIDIDIANDFMQYYEGYQQAHKADYLLNKSSELIKSAKVFKDGRNQINKSKDHDYNYYDYDDYDSLYKKVEDIKKTRKEIENHMNNIRKRNDAKREQIETEKKKAERDQKKQEHQTNTAITDTMLQKEQLDLDHQKFKHQQEQDEYKKEQDARELQRKILLEKEEQARKDRQELYNLERDRINDERYLEEKEKNEKKEKDEKFQKNLDLATKGIYEASKATGDLLTKAVESSTNMLDRWVEQYQQMNDAADLYKDRQSEIVDPIRKTMDEIESETILQQLLFLDPILSKLNDDEIDNLMETYNTLVAKNPQIATDKGLLRNLLRQAANVKSVDPLTLHTLNKVYKSDITD